MAAPIAGRDERMATTARTPGVDLEAARREIAELKQQIDALTARNQRLQTDRNNLLDTIAKLTEVAKTTPS